MAASDAILPAKATPLDASKKPSTLPIDKRATEVASKVAGRCASREVPASPVQAEAEAGNDSDDEGGSEDDESLFGDILESADIQPYVNDGSMDIDDREIAALLAFLRDKGPDEFFKEAIDVREYPPRVLGIAFGIDPSLAIDDELFLRLLGHAVVRTFYKRKKLQQYNTVDDAAQLVKESKNILVITGAGISTSLGIPDFRSKGTGFYDKVAALGYNEPQDVFDILEFDADPSLFYTLAGDILPDHKKGVTPTHAFIKLLQDNGQLQRNYTQNIDDLEDLAGIARDKLIQCHGSFATATCRKCKTKVNGKEIFADIRAKRIARCKKCIEDLRLPRIAAPQPKPPKRKPNMFDEDDDDEDDNIPEPGVMKPDITFFGEQLPDTFFDRFTKDDAKKADLVIVIGTSLKVAPVSEMADYIDHAVPHIYISMEPIKHVQFDIQLLGKCDDVVVELCRRAGWTFRHEKASKVPFDIAMFEQQGHMWNIRAKGPLIIDSTKPTQATQEDRKHTPGIAAGDSKKPQDIERGKSSLVSEGRNDDKAKKRPASMVMVGERKKKIAETIDLSHD
ncbi:Putative Sirtuin family, DHS-like NAD/FAD-binding domain superfamily [Septoria linicola]|uniref:Sirtuin family, DHS-like NAD/FAD-binding domain superfamily n=1 Tax=Septoria linicola TaxID=215465 RepID=A0A9Q9AKA8_9PEZI|nr:putative Sirtuin family, DHS-like NAD/FAD-binding domain superfamily [Septoria linicola]USW47496.1 Putative Sirtuin family, DHS-like NAD/FAD-binding domain superfamily [Septoria linicola]